MVALVVMLAVTLGQRGGDRRSEKARTDQGDNVTLKARGNSAPYLLARLDRDGHAELAADVVGFVGTARTVRKNYLVFSNL